MCVSGSLISSSTWRSSSVSAPCSIELDLLAELAREVAHQARQLVPGVADRLHARLHHAFLQLGGDLRQALQAARRTRRACRCAAPAAAGCGSAPARSPASSALRADRRLTRMVSLRAARRRRVGGRRRRVRLSVSRAPAAAPSASRRAMSVAIVARAARRRGLDRRQHVLDPSIAAMTALTTSGAATSSLALAQPAEHALRGMRQRLEPRQRKESACSLDGMEQAEDVLQQRRIGAASRVARDRRRARRGSRSSRSGTPCSSSSMHLPATARPSREPPES